MITEVSLANMVRVKYFNSLVVVLLHANYLNCVLSLSIYNDLESNDAIFDILVEYEDALGNTSDAHILKEENFSLPVVTLLFRPSFDYFETLFGFPF